MDLDRDEKLFERAAKLETPWADAAFTLRAAAQYGVADVACPPQYAPGRDALMRNTAREREELMDLKRKARPRGHTSP